MAFDYPRGSGRRWKDKPERIAPAPKPLPDGGLILPAPKPATYGEAVAAPEKDEAKQFRRLCLDASAYYPQLLRVYHIPNGGYRNEAEARALLAEGVSPGYPDYSLDVARGGYFGWKGELKRQGEAAKKPRPNQYEWLDFLREEGYWANWHRGAPEMFDDLLRYIALSPTRVCGSCGGNLEHEVEQSEIERAKQRARRIRGKG